jgi:multidrug efflux pump subunit AcrB
MIFVFVFLFGLLRLSEFQYELNPSFDFGVVNITTSRPGSGPTDVELSLTTPIEEELLKVDGLKKMISRSMEGLSVITLRIDPDVRDRRTILANIQKAVDRASTRLPPDLFEKPRVEEMSTSSTPVIDVHLVGQVSEELLRDVARKVEDEIRDLDGVASVQKLGFRKREVRIMLEPGRLSQFGLSHGDVINAIEQRNVRDSGGAIESFLTEKQVVTIGQFSHPREVADVVIRSMEPGNDLKISDIADVVLDYEDWETHVRTDGQPSIVLQVRKKPTADERSTSAAVRALVAELEQQTPPDLKLLIVNDTSRHTQKTMGTLADNALLGFAAIIILLWVFFSLRQAVWVGIGIPFSIMLTFVLMDLFGLSINTISVTALILMLGVLVDDAIVIGESIQRHRENGLSSRDASIEGTVAVSAPVFAAVATTMLAFLPLAFLGGLEGQLMFVFPVVVILVLSSSLLESKLILPGHLAISRLDPGARHDWFEGFRRWYGSILDKILMRRYLSVVGFIAGAIAIVVLGFSTLSFRLFPAPEIDTIIVKLERPVGTGFFDTLSSIRDLEADVREIIPEEDLLNIVSRVGNHDTDTLGGTEGRSEAWALVTVFLTEGERTAKTSDIVEALRRIAEESGEFDSVAVSAEANPSETGQPLELEIVGNNPAINDLAADLFNFLESHPGVVAAWTSYKPGKDILDVNLDHDLLRARGLNATEISQAIRVALDGLIVGELQTVDERIRFRLQHTPTEVGRLATLENLVIGNRQGIPIFLKSVAEFDLRPGEFDIKHFFGKRTETVYADIDRGVISVAGINAEVERYIEQQGWFRQYPAINFVFSGQMMQQEEFLKNFNVAAAICVLSVFFVLVLLFNSFSQPFLIVVILPFSFVGVMIGLILQGLPISIMALIALLGLVGVLVNDSLVLVHTINKRKSSAVDLLDNSAIVAGASERLRPVIVTSLTTIAAVMPAAYGFAGSDSFVAPMLIAMAWGLAFGTVISLVLLPCAYAIHQDLVRGWRRVMGVFATWVPIQR